MLPLAPGLLSTMNCCLSGSESACASWRAYRSVPPPGDEGTMNLTGREGQASCAWASTGCSAKRSAAGVAALVTVGRAGGRARAALPACRRGVLQRLGLGRLVFYFLCVGVGSG